MLFAIIIAIFISGILLVKIKSKYEGYTIDVKDIYNDVYAIIYHCASAPGNTGDYEIIIYNDFSIIKIITFYGSAIDSKPSTKKEELVLNDIGKQKLKDILIEIKNFNKVEKFGSDTFVFNIQFSDGQKATAEFGDKNNYELEKLLIYNLDF